MKEYKITGSELGGSSTINLEEKIKKHQKRLVFVGVVAIVGSLGIFGYKKYIESQENKAQEAMFEAVFAFEKGDYETAINDYLLFSYYFITTSTTL